MNMMIEMQKEDDDKAIEAADNVV